MNTTARNLTLCRAVVLARWLYMACVAAGRRLILLHVMALHKVRPVTSECTVDVKGSPIFTYGHETLGVAAHTHADVQHIGVVVTDMAPAVSACRTQ